MNQVRQFLRHSIRNITGAVTTFLLGLAWFALCVLAVGQIYVATRNELPVPDFVLRRLEARLADTGLRVTFDRATFDPTGRILVTAPQVFLPDFQDPVITATGAYVGLNPWSLAVGKFEPRELRILNGSLQIPAMLSPSGRAEPILRGIDALVEPGTREIVVRHVTGRVGSLQISIHGRIARLSTGTKSAADLASLVRLRFREFCQRAVEFERRLDDFDEPSLDLALESTVSRGAMVTADLVARGFKLRTPVEGELKNLRAKTQFPLLGDAPAMSRLDCIAETVTLPQGVEARGVSAALRGRVRPAALGVEPVEVDLAAEHLRTPDANADAISVVARPRDPLQWHAVIVGRLLGSALLVSGDANLKARTANARFAGQVSPQIMQAINGRVHLDVRKFFNFETLECSLGRADFGPGWKFERLTAYVAVRGINAYGVIMDEGNAKVELAPDRFYAPEAYGRIGDNFAHGSYEHIFGTHEFRFLLQGRLRPMDISGWFREWWPRFFERFAFPVVPPNASVDVHGFWKDGHRTSVFVFADATAPMILGQKLARVRTRLFIRPGFYDGLEMFATDEGGGIAKGTFAVVANPETAEWRTIDFDGESTIALNVAAGVGGALARPILSPFELSHAPAVKASGHFDGPDVETARHAVLDLSAHAPGRFTFHHLPLQDVAFSLKLRDDELTIDSSQARFASGAVRLHAKVWGTGAQRRIGFDASVEDASLGVAVSDLQRFNAERKGLPVPPPGKFVQEKANVRADVVASADGLYDNLLSFHGSGSAVLRGAEIGEVPLLGALSELVKFTALRFTTARTSFKINGPKLEFPDVALRGANSAIDAHGEYALDRQQLDFRAKVFPFQESGSVIKTVVGVVLSPISNVLEVKLTGSLEKPDWAFVIGPTNLLRSLAPSEPETAATTNPPPVPAAAPAIPAKAAETTTQPPAPQPVKPAQDLAPKPE